MRYSGPCLNMGNWSTSLERTRGEKKSRFRRRAPHKDTRAVCRREKMRENWGRNLLPWHWRIPLTRVSFPTVKCSRDSIQFPLKRKKIATGRLFRHHGKPKNGLSIHSTLRPEILYFLFIRRSFISVPLFLFQLHPKETKSLCVSYL